MVVVMAMVTMAMLITKDIPCDMPFVTVVATEDICKAASVTSRIKRRSQASAMYTYVMLLCIRVCVYEYIYMIECCIIRY